MKQEINHKKRNEKKMIKWRLLNNMLLKNQWVNDEIKEEIKKYLKKNDDENTTIKNLWDAAKAFLRGKSIVLQDFIKKQEKSQINNLQLGIETITTPRPEQVREESCVRVISGEARTNLKECSTAELTVQEVDEDK